MSILSLFSFKYKTEGFVVLRPWSRTFESLHRTLKETPRISGAYYVLFSDIDSAHGSILFSSRSEISKDITLY